VTQIDIPELSANGLPARRAALSLVDAALARRGWRLETVVVAENADAALRRLLAARPNLAGLFQA
jgi:hypothetical protein